MKEWIKMPTIWIRFDEPRPLKTLKWIGSKKSDQIAALMLYIVLVHHINEDKTGLDQERGLVKLSYSELRQITGISKVKIAGGLSVLEGLGRIERRKDQKTNVYKIIGSDEMTWGKLPYKGLYDKDTLSFIPAFQKFTLRNKNELNALKLYLLIIAFRNSKTNYAQISYDKITEYCGTLRSDIKSALSLLINLGLIQLDQKRSDVDPDRFKNMYRLAYLERYKHRGTTAISSDISEKSSLLLQPVDFS